MAKEIKKAPDRKENRGGVRAGAGRPKGTRPTPAQRDRLAQRINASRILTRMQKVADGDLVIEDPTVESVRLRAGDILLRKVIPDLARTEHTGEDGGPLQIVTRAE